MNLTKINNLFDLKDIEHNPTDFAQDASIEELEQFIKYCNHYYYNTDKLLVSDYAYEIVKDILTERDPNNPVLTEIGAPLDGTKIKVPLPYYMGSMTKIKPGDKNLGRFIKKYSGPYVISDKLDGVSGLICFNHDKKPISIYTRGEGNIGANIDYIAPYLNLPKITDKIAVRGEFVVSKAKYAKLKETGEIKYVNTRNFVIGVINHKTPNIKHLKMIDFVCYEMIYPWSKASTQFKNLCKLGFKVTPYCNSEKVSEKFLEDMYIKRLELTEYDIDGLIITDNDNYDRTEGENPKYSRAFKLDLKHYETTVREVIWTASKDGLLKPVVVYDPVIIGGNKNIKATCNNGRFVVENKIGKGAIINIIRTNEVLPKVVGVVKPAKHIGYPDVIYNWDKNKVEFILMNKDNNEEVAIQRLIRFFTTLNIENINEGLLKKLYDNGYKTIDDILQMNIDDFMEIDGFKKKLAEKIYNNIHTIIDEHIPLEKLMTASNAFQHGFAEKKLKSIIIAFPDLLNNAPTIEEIIHIDGWNLKTAEPFLERLSDFQAFLDQHNYLKYKLPKNISSTNNDLAGKKIIFTGVRNKNLEDIIENMGGKVVGNISKTTNIIITNDPNGITTKLIKARELGLPIITIEQFCKTYKIKC